jgi:hypothetical protein
MIAAPTAIFFLSLALCNGSVRHQSTMTAKEEREEVKDRVAEHQFRIFEAGAGEDADRGEDEKPAEGRCGD